MKSIWLFTLCWLLCLGGKAWAEGTKSVTLPAEQAAGDVKSTTKTSATKAPEPRGNDQLTLDATVVTGNRELPKVMYIVPWKKAELGNLPGQPFNTLIDETLAPVDRDVFRREVAYYDVIADKDRAVPIEAPGTQATPGADRK
jgi:hypothetical protein